MADDASLGISQYVPSLPEETKPRTKHRRWVGVCVGVGEKYPSIVITQQIAFGRRAAWAGWSMGSG